MTHRIPFALTALAALAALAGASCGGAAPQDDSDALLPDAVTPDAKEPGDTFVPDAHPFDDLTIVSPTEALELCAVAAVDRRVLVRLSPLDRATTSADDLGAFGLGPVDVVLGPWAGEQHLDVAATGSSLARWDVSGDDLGLHLDAVVAHAFGDLGVLEERVTVTRDDATDTRPVDVDAIGDVTFWWAAAESTGDGGAVQLLPCRPEGAALHEHVLVAERDGARLSLVELSDPRARDGALPWRVMVRYGTPRLDEVVDGVWAVDVAREVDSAPTRLAVDLTRSVLHHQLYFGEGRTPGVSTATRGVEVEGDELTLITRTLATGDEVAETWTVERSWVRVDAEALVAVHADTCDGGAAEATLIGLQGSDPLLRIVTCPAPAAPGIDLVAVVPVTFRAAPELVGQTFDAVSPYVDDGGRPGFEIDLGGGRMTLNRDGTSGWYFLYIYDATGAQIVGQLADVVDLTEDISSYDFSVVQASADDAVTLRIGRAWASQAAGASAIFAPTAFDLDLHGERVRVEAWDRMAYTNTHHNWDDELAVTTDDAVYRWLLGSQGQEATLRVEELDGELRASYTLTPVARDTTTTTRERSAP